MILDHIDHLDSYQNMPKLFMVLKHLKALDLSALPSDTVTIEDGIFYTVSTLTTKPASECRFEAHNEYIDVHYAISGIEQIDVQDRTSLVPTEMLFPNKDVGFYAGEKYAARCRMEPGFFLVCFPHDAHKVSMAADEIPSHVKKIVVKVKANLL